MKNILINVAVAVVAIFGTALVLAPSQPNGQFGGLVHNVTEDFSEGISVDGTTRLSGSGSVTADDLSASDDLVVTDDGTFGASTASGSGGEVYILDATATASLVFDSGLELGSCIEMRNTAGAKVYVRVVSTTWTVTTVSCK